jgi:hypothetical protein
MRLWIEPDLSADLRARILRTSDITSGAYDMDVLVGVDAICMFVRTWLEELERSANAGDGGATAP